MYLHKCILFLNSFISSLTKIIFTNWATKFVHFHYVKLTPFFLLFYLKVFVDVSPFLYFFI